MTLRELDQMAHGRLLEEWDRAALLTATIRNASGNYKGRAKPEEYNPYRRKKGSTVVTSDLSGLKKLIQNKQVRVQSGK
jgi:hypothetical protein